ncbi:hypothetical protein, partial [Treponema saccharophilum]|uniref:hypothetical protein n=1 Tax=Treponema saccharophilum TaxID=165 RepID=UPI003868B92D
EAERIAKEKAAKAEAERIAKEKAAKLEAERIAKEKAAKAEAERIAKEKTAKNGTGEDLYAGGIQTVNGTSSGGGTETHTESSVAANLALKKKKAAEQAGTK